MSRRRSRTLVELFVKLGIALLIGPVENCPISSPVRFLIQKLFCASDEAFKIASWVAPKTRYIHSIQIWRVSRWRLWHCYNYFSDKQSSSYSQRRITRHRDTNQTAQPTAKWHVMAWRDILISHIYSCRYTFSCSSFIVRSLYNDFISK